MTIAIACLVTAAVLFYVLSVRERDIPEPEPVSPFDHLDERKAAIYENLRDLQFEYRLGKLSDNDYQQTKLDLQKELAGVLAEVDRLREELTAKGKLAPAPAKKPKPAAKPAAYECPECKAVFPAPMKFCGECGKAMRAESA
ncbi:MAG: hypothetical protein IPM24_15160 [Bryobacterales bacterium]|nr:hypothetical protein [Bryobacterales bacterium]